MKLFNLRPIFASLILALLLSATTFGMSPPVTEAKQYSPNFNSIFVDETTRELSTLNSSGGVNPNVIVLGYSQSARIYGYKSAVIVSSITVTTPAAGVFTCAITDICTDAAHGFYTGLKGQASNSGGALPTGLSGATDYFVIRLSDSTYSLATSYANAIAGTAIDISGTGSGTQTFTPTAIAGGTVSLQGSIDGTTWFDVGSSSSAVTATAVFSWNISDTYYPLVRLKYVNTAGVFTASTRYAAKFGIS